MPILDRSIKIYYWDDSCNCPSEVGISERLMLGVNSWILVGRMPRETKTPLPNHFLCLWPQTFLGPHQWNPPLTTLDLPDNCLHISTGPAGWISDRKPPGRKRFHLARSGTNLLPRSRIPSHLSRVRLRRRFPPETKIILVQS